MAGEINVFFYNRPEYEPPPIDRARFGVEVWLPLVRFGLYLNLGEVVDFVAGWVGLDSAQDDGIDKGDEMPASHYGSPPRTRKHDREKESKPAEPSPR
ncbi:MAG: hypothetical protein HYR85_16445 [Planctomycetes bacterium]|nr:hypothetical protein [Planctomycetota bacterium]